jgi:dTDP-4-amino-4,6-dideoxygalactose transaminase
MALRELTSEPTLKAEDDSALKLVRRLLATNALGDSRGRGPMNRAFEDAFRTLIGVRFALTFNSATSALIGLLRACGIGRGDMVVVDPLVKFGAAAVLRTGAMPVFADVDSASFLIDPDCVVGVAPPQTRAVIATALYGLAPPLRRLRALTAKRGWLLIEDCAQAVLAERDGAYAGAVGDAAIYSFQSSKHLSTGEGGMLVTPHIKIFHGAQAEREHGWSEGHLSAPVVGRNDRMSEITAAIGLARLETLRNVVAYHARIGELLNKAVEGDARVHAQQVPEGARHVYWTWAAHVRDRELRERLLAAACLHNLSFDLGAYPGGPAYRRGGVSNQIGDNFDACPHADRLTNELVVLRISAMQPCSVYERHAEYLHELISGR